LIRVVNHRAIRKKIPRSRGSKESDADSEETKSMDSSDDNQDLRKARKINRKIVKEEKKDEVDNRRYILPRAINI